VSLVVHNVSESKMVVPLRMMPRTSLHFNLQRGGGRVPLLRTTFRSTCRSSDARRVDSGDRAHSITIEVRYVHMKGDNTLIARGTDIPIVSSPVLM
jgi:hypothetical protein